MTDSTASDENLTDRLRLFGVVALDVSLLGCVVHMVSVVSLAGASQLLGPALYGADRGLRLSAHHVVAV